MHRLVEEVAFAYTTALNYLLNSAKHRIRVGDTTGGLWGGAFYRRPGRRPIGRAFFPGL